MQYPGTDGRIDDLTTTIERIHQAGAFATVAADPLALAIPAPRAASANDALHQALLWAPDSNRAATAVGCADAEVGAHTALKGLEAESAGYVQHALRRLRETGRGPQCAPQCG
jgi:hypothetical protein